MECAMEISTINIHLVDDGSKLKAVASIVLLDCFAVHSIKIIEGPNGLFVAMPNRRNKNGNFSDIAHPINRECRKYFSDNILQAYTEAYNKRLSEETELEEPIIAFDATIMGLSNIG